MRRRVKGVSKIWLVLTVLITLVRVYFLVFFETKNTVKSRKVFLDGIAPHGKKKREEQDVRTV